uniref:Uncharacterized protein n=1 Tax=Phasianus colchicus TaxID=9054 RepID=A0A669PWV6_PHACC
KTKCKSLAFKTKAMGCSTKCTPNESLQTLAGHIIPGDMGLDLGSLKTNPKMDLSSTGFFKSGKMGSILSSAAGILPKTLLVSFQKALESTGAL